MNLVQLKRDVYWQEDVEMEIAAEFGKVGHRITVQQLSLYTESVEDYLRVGAHECICVCEGSNKLYRYRADPLKGFGVLTVYFTEQNDQEGSFLLIVDYDLVD